MPSGNLGIQPQESEVRPEDDEPTEVSNPESPEDSSNPEPEVEESPEVIAGNPEPQVEEVEDPDSATVDECQESPPVDVVAGGNDEGSNADLESPTG